MYELPIGAYVSSLRETVRLWVRIVCILATDETEGAFNTATHR